MVSLLAPGVVGTEYVPSTRIHTHTDVTEKENQDVIKKGTNYFSIAAASANISVITVYL